MLSSHMKLATGLEERASVKGIIRRVVTLAEVYEQLLGTGMGSEIDLGDYLRSLCGSLPRLQHDTPDGIVVVCEVESIPVGPDAVAALGMVVAELVANSFEHAFPAGTGTITVDLRRSGERGDGAVLAVGDDGISFVEPPRQQAPRGGSVRRLVQQVRGTAELVSGKGTARTFHLPMPPPAPKATMQAPPT
jgi:two-component sensor histidine kinase